MFVVLSGRHISDIISNFEKRSRSSDRTDKSITSKRFRSPASSTKSPLHSADVTTEPEKVDDLPNTDESSSQRCSDKDENLSSQESKTVQDTELESPETEVSNVNDSVFASTVAATTPTSALASGTKPPLNSLASFETDRPAGNSLLSPETVSALVSEKLNEVENESLPDASSPHEDLSKEETIVPDNATPSTAAHCVPSNVMLDEEVLEEKIAVEDPPKEDLSVQYLNEKNEPKEDENVETEEEKVNHGPSEADEQSLGTDSFLEKSTISQQSPLTSSVFKALGMEEQNESMSESLPNGHESLIGEDKFEASSDVVDSVVVHELDNEQVDSRLASSVESDDEPTSYNVRI